MSSARSLRRERCCGRVGGAAAPRCEAVSVRHAASAPALPTISRPTSSVTPGPFGTTPTRRPRDSTAIRSAMSSSSSRSVEITSAAPPPRGQAADQVANGRGRLHVEAVGRLAEDDDLRIEAQLARQQDLLNVPARERARARSHAGRPHVEFLHELARALVDRARAGSVRASRTAARRSASGTG